MTIDLTPLESLTMIIARATQAIEKLETVRQIDPLALDVSQAAELLRLSPRTLQGMVSARTIPHYKIGASVRFSLEDLQGWLQQHRIETAAEQGRKACSRT